MDPSLPGTPPFSIRARLLTPLADGGTGSPLALVLIALFGATAGQGVVWYTGQFYALFYLQAILKVHVTSAAYIVAVALLLGMPLFVVFGAGLWEFSSTAVATRRGTVTQNSSPAQLVYNDYMSWEPGQEAHGHAPGRCRRNQEDRH